MFELGSLIASVFELVGTSLFEQLLALVSGFFGGGAA
jgi:hypothetical protein